MFNFLLLASMPLVAHASYRDREQAPLQGTSPDRVLPLRRTSHLEYTFPSLSQYDPSYPVPLQGIQDQNASLFWTDIAPWMLAINIPLDPKTSGTMTVGYSHASFGSWTETISSLVQVDTIDGEARQLPLLDVGIRKGGMVSKEALVANLDLSTPYISLPPQMYDVLTLATRPSVVSERGEKYLQVDCASREIFPDIVLGLDAGGDDEEVAEMVITPAQYVWVMDDGTCVLLAKRLEMEYDMEVTLGWAAIRGREVVLDWVNQDMAFDLSL